ncbi:flagellar biosynthesis repressor FlbT [Bradyrhizobium sp. 83012]|uniref:Flagellar biosynthesis repressor FlbT n=1 Tax=Bradyrhizobium aeschynomenes TaxID=2734909 RepID=A0ABX2CRX3_9BRAD|nr:flagellar biosynthesis repressor FlbT [Bradyrhizobium aeschynomenes]NPU14314.1 flagellar biosynthesis repressor FlbT [Bradyrhizobium aeschynomenes]NPU70032.1 flagellar biosynthesis repressor FlbT [Bradyrhizobium aeschynomenes]NPV25835.1 flagellar biosynthesis repressor FlbT [Bradyrhizobium aeschynomenes]
MPLRVELKPFERIVIGDSVIVNSNTRARFIVEGDAPILRERDTVTAETADTPAKRLYLCVQTMYLKNDAIRYRASYLACMNELRRALPEADGQAEAVDRHVTEGALYKALKEIRTLIERESLAVVQAEAVT